MNRAASVIRRDVEPAVIFLSFCAGSVLSQLLLGDAAGVEKLPPAWIYAFLLGAAAVLSASLLGIALLPVCAVLQGGFTGLSAELLVGAWQAGAGPDLKGLALSAVAVPLFFVIAVQGMRSSQLLGALLDGCGPAERARYNRSYAAVAAVAAAGIAAIRWISGHT